MPPDTKYCPDHNALAVELSAEVKSLVVLMHAEHERTRDEYRATSQTLRELTRVVQDVQLHYTPLALYERLHADMLTMRSQIARYGGGLVVIVAVLQIALRFWFPK